MAMTTTDKTDLSFRLGASVLATFAGAAVGLGLGLALLGAGWGHSIARPVAGGALAGALAGAWMPAAAMDFVEGVVHFVFGFAMAGADPEGSTAYADDAQRPRWLRLAFLFGVAFAVASWVLSAL